MQFSVIIPTFNRCDAVGRAIASVRDQTLSGQDYEILLIDNGSTDGTRALVEELRDDGHKLVRYVFEPRPGLHHARHRAAREAAGDILAYTDDDAEVVPGWLESLSRAYSDPRVGAAGGPIHVRWLTPPPEWAPPLGGFGQFDRGQAYEELEWPHTIFGGNFSVRRDLVFQMGGFNPDTSVEDKLVGDGETGLCRKLYAAGWKIVYLQDALVYHVQQGAGVSLKSMRHRYAQQGRFHAYSDYKERRHGLPGLLGRGMRMTIRAALQEAIAANSSVGGNNAYYRRRVGAAAARASAAYYFRLAFSRPFRDVVLREDWINDV